MRWALFLVLIGIVLCAPSKDVKSGTKNKGEYKPATVEIFGTEFTLPEWMDRARTGILGFWDKVTRFFHGDISLSTQVFGKKLSFRTNIPDNREEAGKSISRFFSNVKTDSATRIIFVIYVNLVVLFVTYTLLFLKQIQLHRQQRREEKCARKQRKLDEEERRWMASVEPGPNNIPLHGYPILERTSPEIEKKRSLEAEPFEHSVMDVSDDFSRLSKPRLLLPELFSPTASGDIEEGEDAELSDLMINSTRPSSLASASSEVSCEVEVYAAPNAE